MLSVPPKGEMFNRMNMKRSSASYQELMEVKTRALLSLVRTLLRINTLFHGAQIVSGRC